MVVRVNCDDITITVDREQLTRISLLYLADKCAAGRFVDQDTGVTVTRLKPSRDLEALTSQLDG